MRQQKTGRHSQGKSRPGGHSNDSQELGPPHSCVFSPSDPYEQPLLSWAQIRGVTCQGISHSGLRMANLSSPVLLVLDDMVRFWGSTGLGPMVLKTKSILTRAMPLPMGSTRKISCSEDRARQVHVFY